jgi:outer membrane receptor for ferrienterochelin and colicins
MLKLLRYFFCLFSLVSVHFVGFSQIDTTNYFNLSIEELMNLNVYSASKKTQNIMEAPATMSVIQRKEMDKMGVNNLIDVLKYVPGIETSMGPEGTYRISLRGNRKEGNILLLINGQQVNDFYNGRAIFDLPIAMIEKIEIIRGPGSALFGSNAVAGVINIFLIEETSLNAFVGTHNTYGVSGSYYKKEEKYKFSVSGGYQQSDGNPVLIETDAGNFIGNTWSLTYDSLRQKTNRWNKDAYTNLNLTLGKFSIYSNTFIRDRSDLAGHLYIVAPGSKLSSIQNMTGLSYEFKANDFITFVPKIYHNYIIKDNLIQETPKNYVSNISGDVFSNGKIKTETYHSQTIGGELDMYIKINEKWNVLTGNIYEEIDLTRYKVARNYQIVGDVYKENLGNYDNINFVQNNKKRYVFAYFLQADYHHKNLDLTLGLRYDDYSDFGSSLNPRMGLNYKITENLRVKGLYGKAFRAPTFQELYDNTTIGNQYGVNGNDSLRPEIIHSFELGLEYQLKKMIIKYNVYYILNNNLIRVYDPHGGGSVGVFQNIGNTKTHGHELEITYNVLNNLQFYTNFSQFLADFRWNKEKISNADYAFYEKQDFYYQQLFNIPRIRINTGLTFTYHNFSIFSGVNFGNKSFNNHRFYLEEGSYVEIPSYYQFNFNVTWLIKDMIQLKLSAFNIGTKYSDPEESTNIDVYGRKGLIQPGPIYQIGLTVKF